MADAKITALCALGTAPDSADIIAIVDDPGGTPITKKVTIANLFTSPTLVTPALGTPASGVLTNATGLPVTGLANGTDGQLITWSACAVATTVATGNCGQVLTSNGVGTAPTFQAAGGGGCGFTGVKTRKSDCSITCDTVLTNDSVLTFCVDACSTYFFDIRFIADISATPDLKYSMTVPTNSCTCQSEWGNSGDWDFITGSGMVPITNDVTTTGCGVNVVWAKFGMLQTGACAGTFALQWSQKNSSSCATVLKAGTTMMIRKGA